MAFTFNGGIRVNKHKYAAKRHTEHVTDTPQVKLSMNQGSGTSSVPVVRVGDKVKLGEVIGKAPNDASGAIVHASVSGRVIALEETRASDGSCHTAVVIENDFQSTLHEGVTPCTQSIAIMSREHIIEKIRASGIVGTDSDRLPACDKIRGAIGKAEFIIINCTECEPFSNAKTALLTEHAGKVIGGIKILLRAIGAPMAYIAIEQGKRGIIKKLRKQLEGQDLISLKLTKSKYPQGDDRQLIFALTGREMAMGKLPVDAGCVIFDAFTCAAVYSAFAEGMPLVSGIVTVSGDCVKEPKNLSVQIGTPASHLVKLCGGLVKKPERMIFGDAMTGKAQCDPDAPTKKSTSCVLLLSREYSSKAHSAEACIRCGKCLTVCPMSLMPSYLAAFVSEGDIKRTEKYGITSCTECGACTYVCPGKVDIIGYIRAAKARILTESSGEESAPTVSEKE